MTRMHPRDIFVLFMYAPHSLKTTGLTPDAWYLAGLVMAVLMSFVDLISKILDMDIFLLNVTHRRTPNLEMSQISSLKT